MMGTPGSAPLLNAGASAGGGSSGAGGGGGISGSGSKGGGGGGRTTAAAAPAPTIVPVATCTPPANTPIVPPCRPFPVVVPVQVVATPATAAAQVNVSRPAVVGTNALAIAAAGTTPAATVSVQRMLAITWPLPLTAPTTWQASPTSSAHGPFPVSGSVPSSCATLLFVATAVTCGVPPAVAVMSAPAMGNTP